MSLWSIRIFSLLTGKKLYFSNSDLLEDRGDGDGPQASRFVAFGYSGMNQDVGGLSVDDKFECIGRRRSAWCTKAELSDRADSETPRRLPHADYVLHRTGCSQEDDQLLREGWQWHDSRRRHDRGHAL